MRVMIVSDTHGKHGGLKMALERERKDGGVDMLLHLGDSEGNEDYITALAECPTYIVRGNCDYSSGLLNQEIVEIGEHRIFMTHGHEYMVSIGMDKIRAAAKKFGCDTAMFGHTHKPYLDVGLGEQVTLINPGSIAFPRQLGRKGTYIILEVPEKGDVRYNLKNI